MSTNQSEINQLRHKLQDRDTRSAFVSARNITDSESEEEQRLEINLPRQRRHGSSSQTILLEELVKIQAKYVESQREVFELRSERDSEDVKTRYVKLDLNNAVVKAEEEKESREKFEVGFHRYHSEAIVSRLIIIVMVMVYVYKATFPMIYNYSSLS